MKDEMKTKTQLVEELSILRDKLAALKKLKAEWKRTEADLQHAASLLTSTIESTADGILVIDNKGKVSIFNKKYLSLWRIPESLAAERDDKKLIAHVLSQLKDPEGFSEKVTQLYSEPEADSFDVLEFRDGRVFERFSQPQRLGKKITGRVWSFRDVTDRKRSEEQQRRNQKIAGRLAKEMAVIVEIGRIIGSTLDIDEVYELFVAEVQKLIPSDRLGVSLHSLAEGVVRIAYVFGTDVPGRQKGESFPLAGTLNEMLIRRRSGLLILPESVEELTRSYPTLVNNYKAGVRSMMTVPLIARDEVIGVLDFRSKQPNAYTLEDLSLAHRIGEQVAGAIAGAQLFADLKKVERSLRESEARFRPLFEQAAVGVAEVDIRTGRFLTVNRRHCEILGMTEEELLASTFHEITHPEDSHLHAGKMAQLVAGKIKNYTVEKRYVRKDGAIIWVTITASPLWKPGEKPERNIAVVEDVTERKRMREEIDRRSKLLAALHETSLELTAELNLSALLQSITQNALNLIGGVSCRCYLHRPGSDLLDLAASAGTAKIPKRATRKWDEGAVGQVWATGAPLLINDYRAWPGRIRSPASSPIRAVLGVPIRWGEEFLGVLNITGDVPFQYSQADLEVLGMFATQAAIDIRNVRLYNQIEQVAITDELTGLFNRRGFSQLGEREFERALRFKRPLAALMFDIDHFKVINDTYGHNAGDQVLRALADCFRCHTRVIDVAGRYGGEEFVLLIPETLLPETVQIAERLRRSIEDLSIPIVPAESDSPAVDLRITMSIGVAVLWKGAPNLTALVDRADQAQYHAKRSGRNRVSVWGKTKDFQA